MKQTSAMIMASLLFSLIIVGCTQEKTEMRKVSPQEFQDLITEEEIFVLDVHIPEQEHIPGTDAFIPFNELEQNEEKLPKDKQTPIALYCRSGRMSSEAAQILQKMGYTTIYDLEGGKIAYDQTFGT